MYDFDEGDTGGGGPFVSWSAKGTDDGAIDAKSFYLRTEEGKDDVTAKFKKGVVLDLDNLKTGWCHSTGTAGQAPTWKWNETPARMMPKPGDDYTKGFQIPLALDKETRVVWEQAAAAVWEGLVRLMKKVKAEAGDNEGKLPVVKLTGAEHVKYGKGTSNIPLLEIVKWAPRPECLDADTSEPEPEPEDEEEDAF